MPTFEVPHTIVQCPRCETRFSLESSVIASVESPRFHCSRCDEVFELPMETFRQSSAPRAPQQTELHFRAPAVRPNPSMQLDPRRISKSDFSFGERFTPAPASEYSTVQTQNVVEAAPAIQSFQPEIPVLDEVPPGPETLITGQGGWTLGPIPTQVESISEPQPTISSFEPELTVAPEIIRTPATETVKPQRIERERLASGISISGVTGWVRNWKGAASIGTPLLAVMALLLVSGWLSEVSPSFATWLSAPLPSALAPTTVLPPPAQLVVSNTRFERIHLQTGELVPVVFGKVTNHSQETFDSAEIEVLGFDAGGDLVTSSRSPLRSALARERVELLSMDSLQRLQKTISGRRTDIGPGESAAFTVALTDSSEKKMPSSKIKYYSARVFSVTSAK